MTTRPRRSVPGALAFGAAVALLVSACYAGAGDLGSVAPPPGSAEPSIDLPSPEPTPKGTGPAGSPAASPTSSSGETTTVRVYFMLGSFTGDGGLVPALRTVPKTVAVGRAALSQLLAGPSDTELSARPAMFTAVPQETALLGLTISDGVATVDLSSEFGSGGASPTIAQRYGQVVYALTQFSTVSGVLFELDGQPVPAVIANEASGGSSTTQPVDRLDYVDLLPAIWVDRPAWGGVLASGSSVSGMANVFEAQFQLAVRDADGRTLSDAPVKASCGTGCWGTFKTTVSYTVAVAQWGTLRVYEVSAKDGSPIHVVDYPVWLTP